VGSAVTWVTGLSPWPEDGFGLDRMCRLLDALGRPQDAFEAVHVVGTNGKSTATLTVEQLLLADGLRVGATISPHVRRIDERIRIGGVELDAEEALGRIRAAAEAVGATQFEAITAAAFAAFAATGVDAAVVEAGLGGRYDATNVLRSRVVLLTNVGLEHTDVLGNTVKEIAREKLAVVHRDDTITVLPDGAFASLVPTGRIVIGGAREAAEAFAGHSIAAHPEIVLPGRLELREGEVRDGAHNLDGVQWLVARLPPADYTICASILRDKDIDAMLAELATVGRRFVATTSTNARALPAEELAARALPHFDHVEHIAAPQEALKRAHERGEPVLVTGSLYLLADLAVAESGRETSCRR